MDIETITSILHKKAIDEERAIFRAAANTYLKRCNINNDGAYDQITLKDNDGKDIKYTIRDIFIAISGSMVKSRKERLENKAVTDFMNQFGDFRNYLHELEQYGK